MKITKTLILILSITLPIPGLANNPQKSEPVIMADSTLDENLKRDNYDGYDAVPEVLIVRPASLGVTVLGTASFIALSPLTLFASIAPPHNAFKVMADGLIVRPGKYTFARPMGDFSYSTEY